MKGKSYITENRELAFRIYCEQGGNKDATLRELAKQGLTLSKPTFYEWIQKFCFEERRLKIDTERQKVSDSAISFEEKLLQDLISQKEKYEKYFASTEKIDNSAQYAYANLITTILNLRSRMGSYKSALFLDFMKELISWLAKNDPEAGTALERNFEEFITFAQEKYGK